MTAALIKPPRSLAGLIPDIVVEERHLDRTTITRHPVEQGSTISDHAYAEPSEIILEPGWTNAGRDDTYAATIYAQILALRASNQPFEVVTPKRTYKNMLIAQIALITDEKTENCWLGYITCREIIMARTTTVTTPAASSQALPEQTQATTSTGTTNVVFANGQNSALGSPVSGEGLTP